MMMMDTWLGLISGEISITKGHFRSPLHLLLLLLPVQRETRIVHLSMKSMRVRLSAVGSTTTGEIIVQLIIDRLD